MTNCTVSGNTAVASLAIGGGVSNDCDDTTGVNSIKMTHCTVSGNAALGGSRIFDGGYGGGIANLQVASNNTLQINACTISANTAQKDGGGVYNRQGGANSTFTNCVVAGNTATNGNGGGICTLSGGSANANCTFYGNTAGGTGGGYYNDGLNSSVFTLINCIFYADTATGTGGVNEIAPNAAPNIAASYSDIQGGYPGMNNKDIDPLFVNAPTNDFHLKLGSPLKDAGTQNGAPSDDRDGFTRPNPPSIGAYETSDVAYTHLLWTHPADGTALITGVDAQGNTTSRTYGPFPGWTPKTLADGPDGFTRLLWNRSDGVAQVWTLDAQANFISATACFGPYANWSANALAVDQEGNARLLWNRSDGVGMVWTVDSSNNVSASEGFGPYTNWTATALAVGTDDLSRLLWNRSDGVAQVWTLDTNARFRAASYGFGPYANWSANGLGVGPDNLSRLLWNRSDTGLPNNVAMVWTIDNSNNVTATAGFGPYSDKRSAGFAVGADGLARLLWNYPGTGVSEVWTVSAQGNVSVLPSAAPDASWTAVAVTTGP